MPTIPHTPTTLPPAPFVPTSLAAQTHAALALALPHLLHLCAQTPALHPHLDLPAPLAQLPDPDPAPLLSPFPVLHMSPTAALVHALLPPSLTALISAPGTAASPATQTAPLFFSRLAARLAALTPRSPLVLILPSGTPAPLPELPFPVVSCVPSLLSLVDGLPHYAPSPTHPPRPISLASLEIPPEQLLRLPPAHLDLILELARHSKLLADLRISYLAQDAHLLYHLRTNLHRLPLHEESSAILRRTIAPLLPAPLFSDNAFYFSVDLAFLVRPRFHCSTHLATLVPYSRIKHFLSTPDAPFFVIQAFHNHLIHAAPIPSPHSLYDCAALTLSVDNVFCGASFFLRDPTFMPSLHAPIPVSAACSSTLNTLVAETHVSAVDQLSLRHLLRLLTHHPVAHISCSRTPTAKHLNSFLQNELQARNLVCTTPQSKPPSHLATFPTDPRDFSTAATLDECPPRLTLFVNSVVDSATQVFKLSFVRVTDVVEKLDQHAIHILRTVRVKWGVSTSDTKDSDHVVLSPVLLSSSRARFNLSHIHTNHLSQKQHHEFTSALDKFCKALSCASTENELLISASCFVLYDNHSLLHCVTPIAHRDALCLHNQMTFDLDYPLELYGSLLAASKHPLHRHYFAHHCPPGTLEKIDTQPLVPDNWPLVHKKPFVESMRAVFADVFFGKPANYWSPSGGSASSSTSRVALPTAASEMHTMRSRLRELYIDKGVMGADCVCVNLLGSANLSTGMEVQLEVMRTAGATHLGVGPDVSDAGVCDIVEQYGANTIVTFGTRAIQLAIYCLRNGRRLGTVRRIMHGGENFSEESRTIFSKTFHSKVKTIGIYGSSEAGVFSVKGHGEGWYETISDSIFLEVVDEKGENVGVGEFGTLVVSNLIRRVHPQVRYFTGDVARLVTKDGSKFEVKGRDLCSIRRQFGNKEVTWASVEECVADLLAETFCGVCIYQLRVQDSQDRGSKVTLVVYGEQLSAEQENVFKSAAIERLGRVFDAEADVSELAVYMMQRSEEVHRLAGTRKLAYFVQV